MKNAYFYQTVIGKIYIEDNGTSITNLYFNENTLRSDVLIVETDLLKEAWQQLQDYLLGNLKQFEIPLAPKGTDFQQKVWKELLKIPIGETRSYGQIAKEIGNPTASRAVGNANNKNPILIFIPCHRVIGANGSLVGYAGGLKVKEQLLAMEYRCK